VFEKFNILKNCNNHNALNIKLSANKHVYFKINNAIVVNLFRNI